jgi:DNA-binding transcriptional LysR family regulator
MLVLSDGNSIDSDNAVSDHVVAGCSVLSSDLKGMAPSCDRSGAIDARSVLDLAEDAQMASNLCMRRQVTCDPVRMARDLNLLVTLDVLLEEGSVTRAGERLALSPSAMSRALARLRRATGDPLLVRSGRGLVPTPRAIELRDRVHRLVREAEEVLRPVAELDPATLDRTFTLRVGDGFVERFGPGLVAAVGREAPGVRLRFLRRTTKDTGPLRTGGVDLETGVIDRPLTPDVLSEPLLTDRFIGVVRAGHPLTTGEITVARYASARHVHVARRGAEA